jgi:hypothetical protein
MNYPAWGLVFDIFDAWCLAYETIWGYPKRNRAELAETRLRRIEQHVERTVAGHKELGSVYTEKEIEDLIEGTKNKWEPDIREYRAAARLGGYLHWSFLWAVIGTLSVAYRGIRVTTNSCIELSSYVIDLTNKMLKRTRRDAGRLQAACKLRLQGSAQARLRGSALSFDVKGK